MCNMNFFWMLEILCELYFFFEEKLKNKIVK